MKFIEYEIFPNYSINIRIAYQTMYGVYHYWISVITLLYKKILPEHVYTWETGRVILVDVLVS